MFQEWLVTPTLGCSTLSALATGTVIMMWIMSNHDEKWSFRYMLIMNLTVAGKLFPLSYRRHVTLQIRYYTYTRVVGPSTDDDMTR